MKFYYEIKIVEVSKWQMGKKCRKLKFQICAEKREGINFLTSLYLSHSLHFICAQMAWNE
jgi:hypothetical protein